MKRLVLACLAACAASVACAERHVLVSYTWSNRNIGDIGIHMGLLTLLRDQLPDVPVKMLNANAETSANYRYYEEALPPYHPKFALVSAPFGSIIGHGPYAKRKPQGTAWRKLVDRWGEFRLEQYRTGCIDSFTAEKISDDLLDRFPLDVYADLQALYPKAAKAFDDAAFVYCRDRDSINYLKQCGYTFRDNDYRPDTTVFFHRADTAFADRFLKENGLEPEKFVTLVLRLPAWIDGKPSDMISHAVCAERLEHQLAELKDFVERVTAAGSKVLLAHETLDTLEGGLARKLLWARLSPEAQAKTVYMDRFWTPEEALGVYRRTSVLVSEEMHSMIMAIGNEVPILHCPFAECGRKRQMIRDMGLDDRLVDIDEPGSGAKMFEICRSVAADLPGERARLRKTAAWLETLAQKTVRRVGEIVKCGAK